jgi:hypothetical protein
MISRWKKTSLMTESKLRLKYFRFRAPSKEIQPLIAAVEFND